MRRCLEFQGPAGCVAASPVPKGHLPSEKNKRCSGSLPTPCRKSAGIQGTTWGWPGPRPELASWVSVSGTGRSPEVQLQLRVQEVEQCPPGHGLRVAVIDHQPLVIDVLAADALGPRRQDDDLRLSDVQAWGAEKVSEPHAALPDHRTAAARGFVGAPQLLRGPGGVALFQVAQPVGVLIPRRLKTKTQPRGTRGRLCLMGMLI